MNKTLKLKTFLSSLITSLLFIVLNFSTIRAELKQMSEKDMDKVTAFGFTHFSIDGNTMRLAIDIHLEQYTKIDSLKMGYYYRDDLSTTKHKLLGGNPDYNDDLLQIASPIFSNPQGNGKNENYLDWDINWENVQIGKSEDEPLVIDGLVLRMVYDDIDSPDRKLKEVIIGSNSFIGYFKASMYRSTGMFNPADVDDEGVDFNSWLSRLARHPDHPIYLKRDSFLLHFNYSFANEEDGDADTGQWLMIGSEASQHKGFSVITGYKEDSLNYYFNENVTNYATTDGLKNLWDYQNLL